MAIDPVSFTTYDRDFSVFARALGDAFERYGFVVVSDPGLSPALIADANAQAKAFFALPEATKRAYAIPGGAGQRGYTAFGREAAKGADRHDLKEFWHVGRELRPGHPFHAQMPDNVWPAELPGFRAATQGLYDALEALGAKLLRAVASHLGLHADAFQDAVRDGNSVLRLLHYPPVPHDAPGVRAGAHEDINTITLLLGAEEAGLELLDRDGRWLPVDPPPGAVVVNIGDMLQRLTNHVLPSTTHRVVNPPPERRGIARYSMPFFLHFRPDFEIATLPGCVSDERPDRYPKPITADAYLRERLREIGLA
jgi:isopenicillin N synthase-like dioxygenase